MKKPSGNYTRPLKKRQKLPKLPAGQKAGMIMFVAVGVLMGYSADKLVKTVFGRSTYDITKVATNAQHVYGQLETREVELTTVDTITIENWFSKAIKRNFTVPNLQNFGFEFVGARLTSAEQKPAAYLTYINDADYKLTLFISRSKSTNDGYVETAKSDTLTWHEAGFGYVLMGKLADGKMQKISSHLQNK